MKLLSIIVCVMMLINSISFIAFAEEKIYRSLPKAKGMIALTFDDGPHPKYTSQILDILKREGIKATFFVIGENIGYYDEGIITEIIDDGHELGNHTFNHEHTKEMDEENFYHDVRACHELVKNKYGYEMKIFRPPEGYVDEKVMNIANELDYSIIIWSIDTKDWEHVGSDLIVGNIEKNASDGDIILMHDYVSKPNTTIGALERVIKNLKNQGYDFVTVSELIEKGR